jgi:uncharacterized protein with GYD domain
MPQYLMQISYTSEALATLVANPEDRREAVRPAIEMLGGAMDHVWFAFGDYDIVLVVSLPDNTSAVALSTALSAGGALRTVKTTPLIASADGVEAFKRAAACGYQPPKRSTQSAGS